MRVPYHKVPYQKSYLDVPAQLALLQARGLVVTDAPKATSYLKRLGYYRLSGYWYPFRQSRQSPDGSVEILDAFHPGTQFSQIVDLYVFDKRLRLLFLDAIERIEVGLRVELALLLGIRDPWAHRKPAQLHTKFAGTIDPKTGTTRHANWLGRLDQLAARSHEDFAQHFSEKYSDPLPIWSAIELWDFGLLSELIAGLAYSDSMAFAKKFNLARPDVLTSWVRTINHVRNICAHHSRLWNRSLADQPKPTRPGEVPLLNHLASDAFALSRLYAAAAVMQALLRFINPSTTWGTRLKAHLATFPSTPKVAVTRTGFPLGWEQLPLWK